MMTTVDFTFNATMFSFDTNALISVKDFVIFFFFHSTHSRKPEFEHSKPVPTMNLTYHHKNNIMLHTWNVETILQFIYDHKCCLPFLKSIYTNSLILK